MVFALSACRAPEPRTAIDPHDTLVADFQKANRPRIVDGAPSGTSLTTDEQADWCARLGARARTVLGEAKQLGPCTFELAAQGAVPGVRIRFDATFFFAKPYAAASYDRERRILFLPLAALKEPWAALPATRHEWRHAALHRSALAGNADAAALQSSFERPEYKPDGLYVDELPAAICDWSEALAAQREVEPWRTELARSYATSVDAELARPPGEPRAATRAGVAGFTVPDGFIGGANLATSHAILETLAADSKSALQTLATGRPADAAYRARWCDPP